MPGPTIARETASAPALETEVWRMVADGATTPATDAVAVEEPLEIHLNGWRWLVTMRTPGADADLVLGMLASEGVVGRADEVESIVFRRHPDEPDVANVVDVQLAHPLAALRERLTRNAAITSTSCGLCGAASVAAILQRRPPVAPGPVVDPRLLATLPRGLAASQPTFRETGGLHAAALFDTSGRLLAAREDVGRHNAVDKVLGQRILAGERPDDLILLVTGRISGELAFKAARARISVVATPSVPSTIAVEIAQAAGMVLVGRAVSGAPQVWST